MISAMDEARPAKATPVQDAITWRALWQLALEHRPALIRGHLIALGAALVAIPVPLLMPLLVDEVLLDRPGPIVHAIAQATPAGWHGPTLYIVAVLLATLLLRIATLALGVWQSREFSLIAKDAIFRLRARLLRRLEHVSMRDYETLGAGRVASHLVTDLEAIDQFAGVGLGKFLIAVLSIVGAGAVLLVMHWQLGLLILFLNPPVVYLTTALARRVKTLKRRENAAFEAFQSAVAETLEAIAQIRAYNREHHFIDRTILAARRIREDAAAFAWQSDAASRLSFTAFLFGFDLFRAVSMAMVVFSNLSIGEMLAVFAYLWFMMAPVQEVLGIQYAFASANAALGRINELLRLGQEPQYAHRRDPFREAATVGVALEHASFAYGDGPPVLDDVSIEIAAGEKVALVGSSGGGKTTFVNLLLGLYALDRGRITYGGVATNDIGFDVVRRNVLAVLQHPALFDASVRDNLRLGVDAEDDALWHALDIAQLADDVRRLDRRLDARLGRNGVRLSGGQRQRLAIARMVLLEPKVVILDEATSALDTATEARVHRALADFLRGRTTMVIAHRLSAVRDADRALVFDGGRIIESGRHEELITADGLYARLYGQQ